MNPLTKALKEYERHDLSEVLAPEFYANMANKKGSVLAFDKDGVRTYYKIIRLNRKSKKCEAVRVDLYDPKDVEVRDKENG